MNQIGLLRSVTLAAITVTGASALAAPNVCVPLATGVPSRSGPPKWLDWTGFTTPTFTDLDDPRWLGAAAQSFELGSATASLSGRAVWSNVGGNYLYLSFIVDLEGLTGAGTATPRDLFVGFRRPAPYNNGTPADTTDDEYAYIFQFHLTSGASASLVQPVHCSDYTTCDEASGTGKDFWRVFVDRNITGTCTTGESGPRFRAMLGAGGTAPVTWMTNTGAPTNDAVRYWKLDASPQLPTLLQNRWAVQIRFPIAPGGGLPLEQGIEPGSKLWYQASAEISGTGGGPYVDIGKWPNAVAGSVCPATASTDFLVHPGLLSDSDWSGLTTYSGARPPGCDEGITISHADIGAVFNMPGANYAAVTPTTSFKAGGVNTVIAQPVNTGTTPITAPLVARFRLAAWGASSTSDPGKWKEMRGAVGGVCGLPPGVTSATPPACPATFSVPAGGRAAITFDWTLGNDPTLGASELCMFGLAPPSGSCSPCTCAASDPNCETGTGTQATGGPCVSADRRHQCMLVELSAPQGGVEFVRSSSWNNMNFDQMSSVAREALIDARRLPVGKGQKEQDIYLITMVRNMPKSFPQNAVVDGGYFIRQRALSRAEVIAQPYLTDMSKLSDAQIYEIATKYQRQAPPPIDISKAANLTASDVERLQRVRRALLIMPPADYDVTYGLLKLVASGVKPAELTEMAVREVGSAEAAGIVPTLEVYPFYQHLGVGTVYRPMTAFTVLLSHDGSMKGMSWALDGATQVGQNIFHLRIPVGYAKKIQVRAQAVEVNEALAPPNSRWPCTGAGCCQQKNCGLVSQLGNGLPGLLAGIYVVLRGRRRRRPSLMPLP